uniref:Ig-like domain-containing protein n=1 Tax=Oreochromis aureus TaxID=47969 RepID=A0A668VJN4_OREAU
RLGGVCVDVTSEPGQNVTLPCQAPNNNITVVKWSRADQCVLLYRDEQSDPEHQHPSFKNRVDLQDRQMKNGNVSLILKNVTTADNGTYECHVQKDGDSLKLISNINLSVVDLPVLKTLVWLQQTFLAISCKSKSLSRYEEQVEVKKPTQIKPDRKPAL